MREAVKTVLRTVIDKFKKGETIDENRILGILAKECNNDECYEHLYKLKELALTKYGAEIEDNGQNSVLKFPSHLKYDGWRQFVCGR